MTVTGAQIREARIRFKWSRVNAGVLARVPISRLTAFEKGTGALTPAEIARLRSALSEGEGQASGATIPAGDLNASNDD
jgi:hypothetical protein